MPISLENIDLLQEWIHEKRDKDVFGMLKAGKVDVTETLASPLLRYGSTSVREVRRNPYLRRC